MNAQTFPPTSNQNGGDRPGNNDDAQAPSVLESVDESEDEWQQKPIPPSTQSIGIATMITLDRLYATKFF